MYLRRCHTSYLGSVVLVPTHSAQNVALSLRRSAGSVRDVSRSPLTVAESTNLNGGSLSSAELAESSVTVKRMSASTSHLGASNAKKLCKGTAPPTEDKPFADADGKNARKCHATVIGNITQYDLLY